jgi:hypothetical protein
MHGIARNDGWCGYTVRPVNMGAVGWYSQIAIGFRFQM